MKKNPLSSHPRRTLRIFFEDIFIHLEYIALNNLRDTPQGNIFKNMVTRIFMSLERVECCFMLSLEVLFSEFCHLFTVATIWARKGLRNSQTHGPLYFIGSCLNCLPIRSPFFQ